MTPELTGAALTIAAAEERLLVELVSALARDRPLVLLGPTGATGLAGLADPVARGPASVDGPLHEIEPGTSAVLWVEAEPENGRDEAVFAVLIDAAAAGSPVIVAVGRGADEGAASLLAGRLPGARVLERRVAEVATLAEPGDGVSAKIDAHGAALQGEIVCAGGPVELSADIAQRAIAVASSVRDVQLRALEAANAALREANVRLAREHLGRHDSAAASVVHRLEVAQQRYEQEREIAIENDRLFQDARRRLQQPHHVAADKLVRALKRIPGGSVFVAALKRLSGR